MKRLLGAAAVAVTLASAGAASADVVVFQDAGNTDRLDLAYMPLPGTGTYRFEATSSLPVSFYFEGSYTSHWDIFVAPAPKPHSEFLEGNDSPVFASQNSALGTSASWTFIVPETTYTYFSAPSYYDAYGVPEGTLVYREVKSEDPYFAVFARDENRQAFDYTFSIFRVSAVPEPSTWAMMIVGFGLAGATLRRGSRLRRWADAQ